MDVGAAKEPRDQQVQGTSKQAEQKAFMSCVRAQAKSDREWRNFTFKAHSPVMAEAANLLASDGNVEACKALFEYADAA
jgi:acyl-CoA reductase-like NAD-dependent aldehyde dehydrogenase